MNVTHSVDAYVLRSVIRRASFDVKKVQEAYQLLAADIDRRSEDYDPIEATITDELQTMLDIYKYSQMIDVSILDYIDETQVQSIPNELLIKLHNTVYEMLKRGSSPVVTAFTFYRGTIEHTSAYIRRAMFDVVGMYDETLRIVS